MSVTVPKPILFIPLGTLVLDSCFWLCNQAAVRMPRSLSRLLLDRLGSANEDDG